MSEEFRSHNPFVFIDTSKENMDNVAKLDEAAYVMFASYCSNCYLMAEVLDYVMADTMQKFCKQKWYKQQIKHKIKLSKEALKMYINGVTAASPTGTDYMHAAADSQYNLMKDDIATMRRALRSELEKMDCPDAEVVAELYLVDIMFQIIALAYDQSKMAMKEMRDLNYDERFIGARCDKAATFWLQALKMYGDQMLKGREDITLNDNSIIYNNVYTIINRLFSEKSTKKVNEEALLEADPGEAARIMDESIAIMEQELTKRKAI